MSSSSTSFVALVPMFDGVAWTGFSELLQAYLMSVGLWICEETVPTAPAADATDEAKEEYNEWKESNEKVMGIIRLRVTASVAQHIRGKTSAKAMWDELKDRFGKPSVSAIFTEFKAALDVRVPSNQNPMPALQKLFEHYERLEQWKVTLPEFVKSMLMLSKVPSYAHFVAQVMAQGDKVDELDSRKISTAIVNAWDQHQMQGRGGNRDHSGGGNASRVSAVKKKGPAPNFSQQQQRSNEQQQHAPQSGHNHGGNDKGKKTRRGTRGGRGGRGSARFAFASLAAALPSNASGATKPTLESRLEGDRPSFTGDGAGKDNYPRLKRALELAEDLGVRASSERVRALEDVVDAAAANDLPEFVEGSSRPTKRARSETLSDDDDKPVDWAAEMDKMYNPGNWDFEFGESG